MRLRVCSNFSRSKTRIQLFLNPKPALLNPALLMNGGVNYRILDLTVDGTQSLVWSLGSLVWSQHSFLPQHLWGRDISSLGMEVYPYLCGAVSLARNSSCCLVISTWSHIDRSFNIWRLLLYFLSLLVRQAKHMQFLQSFLRLLWDWPYSYKCTVWFVKVPLDTRDLCCWCQLKSPRKYEVCYDVDTDPSPMQVKPG